MPQSVFPTLERVRDMLSVVPSVVTCKIGLEANMTPADYPMVRVVPSRLIDGAMIGERQVECLIYFGMPLHEFSGGLEEQWRELLTMEASLLASLQAAEGFACQHHETVLDEDRIDAYKLLALRCTVAG